MTDDEWEKIVAYEKARNRVFCGFCETFKYCRRFCKTEEKSLTCKHLHPPKVEKQVLQTVCQHCGNIFGNKELRGHIVSCKMNPKAEERKRKIALARTGTTRRKETKEKISETLKSTLKIKDEEDLKAVKSLHTQKTIKLRFF
jgi:hypothetical protein